MHCQASKWSCAGLCGSVRRGGESRCRDEKSEVKRQGREPKSSKWSRGLNGGMKLVNTTYCTDQSLAARHASQGTFLPLFLGRVTGHRGSRRL